MNFTLETHEDVVEFLRSHISAADENQIDLVLVSVLFGLIEHRLTVRRDKKYDTEDDRNLFPIVNSQEILPLVDDFRGFIRENVHVEKHDGGSEVGSTPRQLIKDVASAVWSRLSKGFHRDKPHHQTLFTFKNGNQLDCFGLAYAVVAGCQVLGCQDVHLCLSEDHAWIVFGPSASETAEITWHGKQNEVHRGEPIDSGKIRENNWLYLRGRAVVCRSRKMEVSAAVAMINPQINSKTDCPILQRLQRDLLWMLDDSACLATYPMALATLADLHELCPALDRPGPHEIYERSVDCARVHFDDFHVYPYTQLAFYLYRHQKFSEALLRWKQAADVLRRYDYNKEDEELYKEIIEIAVDLIPKSFKSCPSSFFDVKHFMLLLLFYDGVCEWEQNGSTPVFHNAWARYFAQSVSYFSKDVRDAAVKNFADSSYSPETVLSEAVNCCVGPENTAASVGLRSTKMQTLLHVLTKDAVRASAVEMYLCAQTVSADARPQKKKLRVD